MSTWRVCRLCDDLVYQGGGAIQYGPRHWAHPACFAERKGAAGLRKLHTWQLEQFPAMVAEQAGVLETIAEILAERAR